MNKCPSTDRTILVVGGAGYIGSHMCKYLKAHGYCPVVLDSLVTGHRRAVKWGPFIEGDMADTLMLDRIFSDYRPAAVMHFAAFCYVGESVTDPFKYYMNNVSGSLKLLGAMRANRVSKLIFSSSCATYGEPEFLPITEDHPQNPINPYGQSKLMAERILSDMKAAYGLDSISLRYFNAAGADPDAQVGEVHDPETHLIPLVLQTALGMRDKIQIFGDDYQTEDGTCVRDYIHVDDIAQAHLLALERLLNEEAGGVFNLGNGDGYSVAQVIETAKQITGKKIPVEMSPRRCGDPGKLISASGKAMQVLGWKPRFPELGTIIETAWKWHRANPDGFADDLKPS